MLLLFVFCGINDIIHFIFYSNDVKWVAMHLQGIVQGILAKMIPYNQQGETCSLWVKDFI